MSKENEIKKIKKLESTVEVTFEHIKTFSFLNGMLPNYLTNELNNYIDKNGEVNPDDAVTKGVYNLLKSSCRTFLSLYNDRLLLSTGANDVGFENLPIDISDVVIHNFKKNEHDLLKSSKIDLEKSISCSILLYLKIPDIPSKEESLKKVGGYTHFQWGINNQIDEIYLKPRQHKKFIPRLGEFMVFPSWVNYSFIPFNCDGTLRVLSSNLKVNFTTINKWVLYD